MSGEAQNYYNAGYQQPPPQQYQTQQPQGGYQQQMPPPPNYGQQQQQYAPPQPSYDAKANTFDGQFKIEKPKWNDLWAGILLIAVFCGFVAVSGLTIEGYSAFKGLNGSGIYNNRSSFGLNTNTIVLFAFVLLVALVLSTAYLFVARTVSHPVSTSTEAAH